MTPDAFEQTLAPLWRRAQSGDEAAYREALRLMAGRVRGFLRAKVRVVAHIVAWLPTSWVDLTVMC